MKFRKKPIVVEAVKWKGIINNSEVLAFAPGVIYYSDLNGQSLMTIVTREGRMTAIPGDWIIKEPFPTTDRRFYPCKPDIFEATYERVEE